MCQLNVYCISEKISKEKIQKSFNRFFGLETEIVCINDKFSVKEKLGQYHHYINSCCNCDSIVSCYQEYEGDLSFEAYHMQLCEKEVERLSEIRRFMQGDDYKKEKVFFDEKIRALQTRFNEEFKIFAEKEGELWLTRLEEGSETSLGYQQALRDYQEFIEKNDLMWRSYGFYVKGKKTESGVSDINIAIKKARVGRIKELKKEFHKIKRFFGNIIKLSERIGVFSCWEGDEQTVELQKGKEIKYSNFKIEDIAFLKNKQVLWIVK